MSLLQINTAIPLAQPLLEQQKQHYEAAAGGRISNTERRTDNNSQESYKTKFIILGALTGFFIQVVSLGAYAFLLVHYQFQGQEFEVDNDASTTTTAALMSGFLKQQQQDGDDNSSVATGMPYGTDSIMYTILSVLTQVDLVVYVLIWIAFTCTMTRNGMTCIRSQFFNNIIVSDNNSSQENETSSSSKKTKVSTNIKRRYIFVLGVNFLVGIVLGAFIAWTIIDIYLGFPIPLKPILFTVSIDLLLCYLMVFCFDMGKTSKRSGRRKSISIENIDNDEEEEIEFSNEDDEDTDTDTDYDSDDDEDRDSSWC